jgi:hypothetical protein
MNYTFTYKIIKADVTSGNMLVKYTPLDGELTAITLNISVVFDENNNPIPLEQLIEMYAPQAQWAAQAYIKDNYEDLINKTGNITPTL